MLSGSDRHPLGNHHYNNLSSDQPSSLMYEMMVCRCVSVLCVCVVGRGHVDKLTVFKVGFSDHIQCVLVKNQSYMLRAG